MRRLTVDEYIQTIDAALGVDASELTRELLPADIRADGFTNTAYNLQIELSHVEAYAQIAADVAARFDVATLSREHGGDCQDMTDACHTSFIEGVGLWLMRGPLSEQEREALLRVPRAVGTEGGDFEEAARYTVEAMLQSPRFLFRVERQRGDGQVASITGYELAARLSYLLWGAPPDDTLLAAARGGELITPQDIEAQVTRMLEDPRTRSTTRRFAFDWLALARLRTLDPDAQEFPSYTDGLTEDMLQETLTFVERVLWDADRPVGALFDTQTTWVTPALADYYGIEGVQGPGAQEVDLTDVPTRGGLLTHASLLTVGGYEASMVGRGLFLLEDMLCGHINDPPPGVDVTPVPATPGVSQRMIAEERVANPSCGGCHTQFEPLAYGLETYDGMGAHHVEDIYGNTLREDGALLLPGRSEPQAFTNAAQVGALFASSERVQKCMTHKVTQFAIGRPLVPEDACMLQEIVEGAQSRGGSYAALLTAIATSPLLRTTRTEP